jgi:ubiquinone biosynthesis protein COQ9
MNWLRARLQGWIDRKTQEIHQYKETLEHAQDDLESAKTIGELRTRTEKWQKLGIIAKKKG